ncbi:MAG: ribonuclease P protein component [Bacteroidales bacterium]|nr:ribonuclease P protein component [Bacteroidales bacterium]
MGTLPKSERLKGKVAVSALMSKGRWGHARGLKYCYASGKADESGSAPNRVLVSVPKKLFKRAVKRNLLKRRMREAYRTNKDLLPACGTDLMLIYNSPEINSFETIREQVTIILKRIDDERQL